MSTFVWKVLASKLGQYKKRCIKLQVVYICCTTVLCTSIIDVTDLRGTCYFFRYYTLQGKDSTEALGTNYTFLQFRYKNYLLCFINSSLKSVVRLDYQVNVKFSLKHYIIPAKGNKYKKTLYELKLFLTAVVQELLIKIIECVKNFWKISFEVNQQVVLLNEYSCFENYLPSQELSEKILYLCIN